jgi:MFS family permease
VADGRGSAIAPERPATTRRFGGASTIILAGIAKFASGPGQSFFLAAFVEHLISDGGVTRSGFAALYAIATVVSSAMTLFIGRLVDRHGVGWVWLGVAGGLAAACVGLSVATGPLLVFAALSLMRGFGQGAFPLLGTLLVATRFAARRGRALSLSAQGLTGSGVLLPLIAAALISSIGWRHALQVVAAALLVAVLPLGLLAGGRPAGDTGSEGRHVGLVAALRRPGVPKLLAILGVPPLVSTAIIVNAVALLGRSGLDGAAAASAVSLTAVAGAGGALLAGQLADRFRPRVLLAVLGVALVVAVALMIVATPAMDLAALVALGLSSGMSATANGTVWASVYGVEGLGGLQGAASAGQIAGAAAGPLVLAAVLALTASYALGLAALLVLAVGATLAGWRWQPPVDHGRAARQPGVTAQPCHQAA